jgi:hypothetical protein
MVTTPELSSCRTNCRQLTTLALDIIQQLPEDEDVGEGGDACRYSACVVDVFVTCLEWVTALRDEGFLITACMPSAGKLVGHQDHVANYIMYRELAGADRMISTKISCAQLLGLMTTKSNASVSSEGLNSSSPGDSTRDFQPNMLISSRLPMHTVLSDGTRITVRSMRSDEIQAFYSALVSAADHGHGYGTDELPTIDYFIQSYIDKAINLVYELTITDDDGSDRQPPVVAYSNIGRPSHFCRSAHPVVAEGGNMVIVPEYRGNRWYGQLVGLMVQLLWDYNKELVGVQGDAALTNTMSYAAAMSQNGMVVGVLPKAIQLGHKDNWVDLLLFYGNIKPDLSKL